MRFDLHYFIQQFNLAYQMELLLRIVIACILGYMIGYERKSRDKSAGIWTTAGVGMAIGAGAYFIGICGALLVVLTQIILHKISFLTAEPYRGYLKVTTNQYSTVIIDLQEQFTKEKIRVIGLKVNRGNSDHTKIEFDLLYPARYEKNELITFWSKDMRVDMISG